MYSENFIAVALFLDVKDQEIMNKNKSLAKKYLEYYDAGMPNGTTWNDFYDYAKVSPNLRTDFASRAILKQAQELIAIEQVTKCSPSK